MQTVGRLVFSRIIGAFFRAVFVLALITLPALAMPESGGDLALPIALIAAGSAVVCFAEYISTYPGLIEFRSAPPYNRLRFALLAVLVFLSTGIVLAQNAATAPLPGFFAALGLAVGQALATLPFDPTNLAMLMLPADAAPEQVEFFEGAAGLMFVVSLLGPLCFALLVLLRRWPRRGEELNIWVNLPSFGSVPNCQAAATLLREAWMNVAFGFLLPFLLPLAVKGISLWVAEIRFDNPLTMIWTLSAWAYLPANLLMRGVAMARMAAIIEQKCRSAHGSDIPQPI